MVGSQSVNCIRRKCEMFVSFHTIKTTNMHLFVANTDVRSQRTLISGEKYNLAVTLVGNKLSGRFTVERSTL